MATTGSGSHQVVDFGISSAESLPCATMKLHNYVSKRMTASGLCQFVISNFKIRKVTGTPRHEVPIKVSESRNTDNTS
jgi:hypothetical protein